MNPARSFSSAFFARIWHGIWVYFAAPVLGMMTAASLYVRGEGRVYCAKVFHDLETTCPFACNIDRLYSEAGRNLREPRPELTHKEM